MVAVAAACGDGPGGEAGGSAADRAAADASAEAGQNVLVTVYKSPTCGCCTKWVDHIRDAGFRRCAIPLTCSR